ncbi:MAG: outer membrane beta-barrel protein [Flavisolibacter sp.]
MRIVSLLLVLAISFSSNAQEIVGIAKDADGKLLNGATVSLLKDTGRAILKYTVTKDGNYAFEDIKPGRYRISASHVGFTPAMSPVIDFDGQKASAPDLKLAKASAQMANVTVSASKPIVEVKADKTVLNVEGTINSVGSDALELLRKSPGVLVDKDENLSVNGKNGVQVYVDGRPTPLSGQDLSNYLKSIQSTSIESIEIITNPSAKYEAAGNAGIINIRLKKNKALGTNGSVNAGVNFGHYPKYNGGITLNHRNKNMNIFGNYAFNKGKNINHMSLYRTVADSLFDQHGTMTMENESHNYKAGIDFFLDKKNVVGVMVNGTFSHPSIANYSKTGISYQPTSTTDRILVADNNSTMKRNNVNLNVNYTYTGTDGKSLVVNADHGYYDIRTNQLQPNYYYDPTGTTLKSSVVSRMVSPTNIYITSVKGDWEQNFKKGKLGYGGKIAFVKSNNDFQNYDVNGSSETLNIQKSNEFDYKENINAGYVNYNRQFKGIMLQAGVRVENTVAEGISTGVKNSVKYDSTFNRNYTDVFPSAAITFNKNPMNQFGISYSKRIDRPAYQDLNPFEFKLDEYTFQKGNVNLRPQYTNSIGISNTYKYRLTTSLNYSHVKDMFAQWIDTTEKSKAFVSKKNLAQQDIIAFNISYPYQYKSYMVFANLSSNYSKYKADFGPGRKVDQGAFGMTVYAQNSLKFGKTKTWTGELTGFYVAPTIQQGAFKSEALWSVDAGLSKNLWKNKATIKTSFSDIFNTLHFTGTQQFAGQSTRVQARWESQLLKVNFVYRFGSNQVKAARNRTIGAEEETKRTQGASGLGIGQQ